MADTQLYNTSRNKNRTRLILSLLLFAMRLEPVKAIIERGLESVLVYADAEDEDVAAMNLSPGISFAGGSFLMMQGTSFAEQPSSNTVYFTTSDLSSTDIRFTGTQLTQHDEFHSDTQTNMLAYSVPAPDLLFGNGLTMDVLKAFDYIDCYVSVTNNDDQVLMSSPGSNWVLARYRWSMTPVLQYVSPAVVYPGITQSIRVNKGDAMTYKHPKERAVDIKIDGTNIDFEGYLAIEDHFSSIVHGKVTTRKRNKQAEIEVKFRGAGHAFSQTATTQTCDIMGTDCYEVRVVPTVLAVSASSGYTIGGQILTITGTSLDGNENIEILVDGVPCIVQSSAESELTCETGETTLDIVNPASDDDPDISSASDDDQDNISASDDDPENSSASDDDPDNLRSLSEDDPENSSASDDDTENLSSASEDDPENSSASDDDPENLSSASEDDPENSSASDDDTENLSSASEDDPENSSASDDDPDNLNSTSDNDPVDIYVGQHGLRRKAYNNTLSREESTPTEEWIMTSLEIGSTNEYGQSYHHITGFFEAPIDGEYQFHQMYGRRGYREFDLIELQFYMSISDPMNSRSKQLLLNNRLNPWYLASSGNWREFYRINGHISDVNDPGFNDPHYMFTEWITLVAGQKYYIEANLKKYTDLAYSMHMTIGFEVLPTDPEAITEHHMFKKQVQELLIYKEGVQYEQTEVTVKNADQGLFKLSLLNADFEMKFSSDITAGDTASDMQWKIDSMYNQPLTVFLTCKDVDEVEVDCETSDQIVYHVYIFQLNSLIEGITTELIDVYPMSTQADITVRLPSDVQTSDPPLDGNFFVECPDVDGESHYTSDIPTRNLQLEEFKEKLIAGCPFLRNDIVVQRGEQIPRIADGVDFIIYFEYVNGEVGTFSTHEVFDAPLPNATMETRILQTYGPSIFYPVIPFEMVYTNEVAPQVVVSIDGLPAVCAGMQCDYIYKEPTSLVTSMIVDALEVTIVGSGLTLELESVTLAKTDCVITANNTEQITCTMALPWTVGTWLPEVRDSKGLFPIDSAVQSHVVYPVFTSVTPNTGINPAGGDELVLVGSNFASTLTDHPIQIQSSDGTLCDLTETTSTEMKCITRAFIGAIARRRLQDFELTIAITINEIVSEALSITVDEYIYQVESITPDSASPILMRSLVLKFTEFYPVEGMVDDKFSVSLYPQDPENTFGNIHVEVYRHERPLNVVAIDPETRSITVKYGGAYSGIYDLIVASELHGRIISLEKTFTAKIELVDFQPKQGSLYGGTKVTITGGHFSDLITDNPVKIGYRWWTYVDNYCYVIRSSDSEIVCRVAKDYTREPGEKEVIVFASTFEEAKSDPDNRDFTFLDVVDLPIISGVVPEWDDETNEYNIVITGTDITDTTIETVEVFIGELEQSILSVSTDEIKVQITDINAGLTAEALELYLEVGIPHGMTDFFSGVTFEPKLLDLSTHVGSSAGAVIQATVKGVGINDKVDLIDSATGLTICSSTAVIRYGLVECKTLAQEIPQEIDIQVVNVLAREISQEIDIQVVNVLTEYAFGCANSDTTKCQYKTFDALDVIEYTSVTQTSMTQIKLSGTNLDTFGAFCQVTFAGIIADECAVTIDAGQSVVLASYSLGVPASDAESIPDLRLKLTDDEHTTEQIVAPPTTGLSNPLAITQETAGLSCSFAGGCVYTVEAEGLTSKIRSSLSEILICKRPCILIEEQSDHFQATCQVPLVETVGSHQTLNLSKPSNIIGPTEFYFVDTAEFPFAFPGVAFDGNIQQHTLINSNENPYMGTTYTEGYVGILTRFKFFVQKSNAYANLRGTYTNELKLQGSSDEFEDDINDIWTAPEDIYPGWNNFDLSDQLPQYASYRMWSGIPNGCNFISEVELIGHEVLNSDVLPYDCQVEITQTDGETKSLIQTVQYDLTLTPIVTSVSPRWGSVEGNTEVTFSGSNLSTDVSLYTISMDGIECLVSAATEMSVTCTTQPRTGLYESDPTLEIWIEGKGLATKTDVMFRYVSLWSQSSTWGDLFAPVDNESVSVPQGLHLLVDIDVSPKLQLVIVDGGSIIFPHDPDPMHVREFHAHYIFIHYGLFEAGTEEDPYTSKLSITMYGEKYTPPMPIYGNKCIGVRYGTLDMHGVPRSPTWTTLESTAQPGDTEITLHTPVDWQAGEWILIAPTDNSINEIEHRMIAAVLGTVDEPVIQFDPPLSFKHYAAVDMYGDEAFEQRAEVGLLTRNIQFAGDTSTSEENLWGAHIMIHSPGDESSVGRIEYVELHHVGQAFMLGRYPIHFHKIGTVHQSYIRGNSVSTSYNRGTTIHRVHYLKVEDNVYWNIMGHVVFIEDGPETNNRILNNLVMVNKVVWSLLESDARAPSCFWITNPDNVFIGNHAIGCANGFWFDLRRRTPTLGAFRDNVGHTNRDAGLQIDTYVPGQTVYFESFRGYKNRLGIDATSTSNVVYLNCQLSDNRGIGISIHFTHDADYDIGYIDSALVVGRTLNNSVSTNNRGIWLPQNNNYSLHNSKFYNFDTGGAALSTCNDCKGYNTMQQDAFTYWLYNTYIDEDTVPLRIIYGWPGKSIILDKDGTFTGLGPGSWATAYFTVTHQENECLHLPAYGGVICNSSIQIRRGCFRMNAGISGINIQKYDDDIISEMSPEELEAYHIDSSTVTGVGLQNKKNPARAFCMPWVTGHKYLIRAQGHWSWQSFEIVPSLWGEDDKHFEIQMIFYNYKEAITVSAGEELRANNTLAENAPNNEPGDNIVFIGEETGGNVTFAVTGAGGQGGVRLNAITCISNCSHNAVVVDDPGVGQPRIRYWSNPLDWDNLPSRIPVEDDEVVIMGYWNMIFDIVETPKLKSLQINGILTFEDTSDRTVRAYSIWVRAGTLNIGTEEEPFQHNVLILLLGDYVTGYWAFGFGHDAGNKNLVVTGQVNIWGKPRSRVSRLLRNALSGTTEIQVEKDLDWQAGDEIVLAPTNRKVTAFDQKTVESYDPIQGYLVVNETLRHYHFGATDSTFEKYGVDMRGEVALINRNIKITASREESSPLWPGSPGCRILVADFFEQDWTQRKGSLNMDNVEIEYCAQPNNHAAISWEKAIGGTSRIANSVIHNSPFTAIQMQNSRNVILKDNLIYDTMAYGIKTINSMSLTFDGNWIFKTQPGRGYRCKVFCSVAMRIHFKSNIVVINNIFAGIWDKKMNYSVIIKTAKCGEYPNPDFKFLNNSIHSNSYGVEHESSGSCSEMRDIIEYKNGHASKIGGGVKAYNYVSIENSAGWSTSSGTEMIEAKLIGEIDDNVECYPGSQCSCSSIVGISARSGTTYTNLDIIDFDDYNTACGSTQTVYYAGGGLNELSYNEIVDPLFTNLALAALIRIPNAYNDKCGPFPCTGYNNGAFYIRRARYRGTVRPIGLPNTFQIVTNNIFESDAAASVFPGCRFIEVWNAYLCIEEHIGQLIFESMDHDKKSRFVQPVYITNEALGFHNTLNAFANTCEWKLCMLQRFPTIIWLDYDRWDIEFTGMNPSKLDFWLKAPPGNPGVLISIRYPFAQAFQVFGTGEDAGLRIPTDWDHDAMTWAEVTGRYCGENRFEGVINRLQFWIEPGCELRIRPRDAIMLAIRMEFTFREFFARGGIVTFVDRMAASIGLHAADIKVVQVYEGSTIVDFQIIRDLTAAVEDIIDFEAVKATFNEVMSNTEEFMGSKILNFTSTGESIRPEVDIVDLLWPDGGVPVDFEYSDDEDESVLLQIQHEYSTNEGQEQKSEMTGSFIIILIIILLLFGIVAYVIRRLIKNNEEQKLFEQIEVQQVSADVETNRSNSKSQLDELEKQYVPKADERLFSTKQSLQKVSKPTSSRKTSSQMISRPQISVIHEDADEMLTDRVHVPIQDVGIGFRAPTKHLTTGKLKSEDYFSKTATNFLNPSDRPQPLKAVQGHETVKSAKEASSVADSSDLLDDEDEFLDRIKSMKRVLDVDNFLDRCKSMKGIVDQEK